MPFPDISPEVFSISLFGFTFALRWYALAYIAGILIGWQIVNRAIARPGLWAQGHAPITREQVDDLVTWVILGVILGGRLGYVLFYHPSYFMANPQDILKVWQGGMSFHGGFIGVILAVLYTARKYSVPLGSVADLLAIATPPALLLGRIANFINAELWGRPSTLPWAVAFPGEAAQTCPDVVGVCTRHPSQLYEAGLEGLVLGIVMVILAFSRGWLKTPWRLTGVFALGYGLARFTVEFVRQPDAQFVTAGNPLGLAWHINGYGLTMGQILSVPMIVIGLWLIWRRR